MTDRFIGLSHHSLYFDFAIVNAENATLCEYIVQIIEEFFWVNSEVVEDFVFIPYQNSHKN